MRLKFPEPVEFVIVCMLANGECYILSIEMAYDVVAKERSRLMFFQNPSSQLRWRSGERWLHSKFVEESLLNSRLL